MFQCGRRCRWLLATFAEVRRIKLKNISIVDIENLQYFLDLNQMNVRPPREIVTIEAASDSRYIVKQEPSLADNILVVGERYQPIDISSISSLHLGKYSSGVTGKETKPTVYL